MTRKKIERPAGFDAFMKRVLSPAAVSKQSVHSEVAIPTSEEFDDYACLTEESYHNIHVAVSDETLKTHQILCDFEYKIAESQDERNDWKTRREPKIVKGVPYLSLVDAMDVCNHRWADKNNLLDKPDLNGDTNSPQCGKFHDITTQLFALVWNGLNPDHLAKQLEEALYDPRAEYNILNGKHSAKQVAETIIDFAHAQRVEFKGPNRDY